MKKLPTCRTSLRKMNNFVDEYLLAAELEAKRTGSMVPLLKQELKCFIQGRRLAEGRDELLVEFNEEQHYDLTEEEIMKQTIRRAQNKQAAKRFRQQRKNEEENLKKKLQKLQSSNTSLHHEIASLTKEKECLQKTLQTHLDIYHNHNAYW